MKKVLVLLLTACVVFGAAAAFAQSRNDEKFDNSPYRHNNMMNFQGQQGEFCEPNGNGFGGRGYGMRGDGYGFGNCRGRMNFTPDMPKEIREKAVELAKLRVDLEEAISSVPVNKAKALDTYAKMQKLEQEIKMWRFTQRLESMEKFREDFKKQRELNKKIPPAKDAPAK